MLLFLLLCSLEFKIRGIGGCVESVEEDYGLRRREVVDQRAAGCL